MALLRDTLLIFAVIVILIAWAFVVIMLIIYGASHVTIFGGFCAIGAVFLIAFGVALSDRAL